MGWRICFFGFNRAPAIPVLERIQWLTSWRLFDEPATQAWFLEGQSSSAEITFYEEVKTHNRVLTKNQKALLTSIETKITENGGFKQSFDTNAAEIAMLLSQELNQPVATFVGDDEGVDSCFIFDTGRLVRGRLQIDRNKALAFDADGNVELEWLYPEGVSGNDPDLKCSRTLYQIGIEEADAFFGRHTLNDTLSFDRDFKTLQFVLKTQKGEPDPPIISPTDKLYFLLGWSPAPKQVLDAFAPVVETILDAEFPSAPNAHRFEMDFRITSCSAYLSRLRMHSSGNTAFLERLHSFMVELSTYTRRLRPASEFRKSSIDFRRSRKKLSADWHRIKLRNQPWLRRLFG